MSPLPYFALTDMLVHKKGGGELGSVIRLAKRQISAVSATDHIGVRSPGSRNGLPGLEPQLSCCSLRDAGQVA